MNAENNKFYISLPLQSEFLTTVRLTAGGLCAMSGFDVDTAEDFKVCVTECLLILKRNGYLAAEMCFGVGESLSCSVAGKDKSGVKQDGADDGISYALLNALLGDVQFIKDADGDVQGMIFEG